MSRSLPVRPNLEHLKNQAKDRLCALQHWTPSATLSDALHAVAQEYGFKTWPELKERVESVARVKASDARKAAEHGHHPVRRRCYPSLSVCD
jgi:hypothetical protein